MPVSRLFAASTPPTYQTHVESGMRVERVPFLHLSFGVSPRHGTMPIIGGDREDIVTNAGGIERATVAEILSYGFGSCPSFMKPNGEPTHDALYWIISMQAGHRMIPNANRDSHLILEHEHQLRGLVGQSTQLFLFVLLAFGESVTYRIAATAGEFVDFEIVSDGVGLPLVRHQVVPNPNKPIDIYLC